MIDFICRVWDVVCTALTMAVIFGALTAAAIGLARLIQFLASM